MSNDAFSNFTKSAFRLETLPEYRAEYESELLARFLNNENVDIENNPDMIAWCELVSTKTKAGAVMERARVVCNPVTDYLRYEMTCAYPMTTAAGEKVRILSEDDFDITCDEDELDVVFNRWGAIDFWLFDDEHMLIMDYDDDGTWLGFHESRDDEDIKDAMRVRDAVMAISHFVEI
jgi:hypothetical protein